MIITLSPQRRDETLTITKSGDSLTLNGETFNFSSLAEGVVQDVSCEWIVGPVARTGSDISLTLILPHGPNPPQHVAFPEPIIDPPDGEVRLPAAPAL